MPRRDRLNIVCVLGGGGARGLAHLGILEVLEREDVPVNVLVGRNLGAILASLYAFTPRVEQVIETVETYVESESFRDRRIHRQARSEAVGLLAGLARRLSRGVAFARLLRRPSVFDEDALAGVIGEILPDRTFEESLIPLAISATDLETGEDVLLTEGPVRPAAVASCALPGFFPPVERAGRRLADVGLGGAIPVEQARGFRPGVLIACDVAPDASALARPSTGLQALLHAQAITERRTVAEQLERAHVVVRPEMGAGGWLDFSRLEERVAAGREACEEALPTIRRTIERARAGEVPVRPARRDSA